MSVSNYYATRTWDQLSEIRTRALTRLRHPSSSELQRVGAGMIIEQVDREMWSREMKGVTKGSREM